MFLSFHILYVKTGRWNRPVYVAANDRRCITCNVVYDKFHFDLKCS